MKRWSVFFLTVAMIAVFAGPSFAILRKDLASVKGTVTYINSSRTEITIKQDGTGKDVSFSSPGVAANVMIGSRVVVLYKAGTMNAKTVRVIPAKKAAMAAKAPVSYSAPKAASYDTYEMPQKAASSSKSGW